MKRISAIMLAMLVLSLFIAAVSASVISLGNSEVNAVGDTATVNLEMDEAPLGMSGYSIVVSVDDPSVATITAVGFPAWATMTDSSAVPSSSVNMKALDMGDAVKAGATAIPLGSVTLKGQKEGSTGITVTVTRMDDDTDNTNTRIYPTIRPGTFTVTTPATPTPTATTTPPVSAPSADFLADPVSGNAPLTVAFTDNSTGDGISAWAWDFNNDGTIDSTEQNPQYTYSGEGTYSVKLVVTGTGGTGETTKNDLITVSGSTTPTPTPTGTQVTPPVGNFSADPLSGDAPLTVQFADDSAGEVTSWVWDVNGDGTTECTTKDCTYTYTDPGTYTVKLTVSNDGGFDNVVKNDYISVTSAATPTPTQVAGVPTADFAGTPLSGEAPLSVRFADNSSGEITGYAWDFNNDGTIDSTEKDPSYTYGTAGTYTVHLNVTGPGGSADKILTDYIAVSPAPTPTIVPVPEAAFFATPTSGYAPLTVQFTDNSTGDITGIYWDFTGDLQPDSTDHNPVYTFTEPGNYTIYMAVTGPGGLDYEVKTNYINVLYPAPVAGFSATPTSGDAPLSVQFTDESTGNISSYAWDFDNDGTIDSTEKDPAFVYSAAGSYAVNLTVAGPGGSDSRIRDACINVTEPIAKPAANFSANATAGTVPLAVLFTDESAGTGITAYAWDFDGDGVTDSTVQNPEYVYPQPGVYNVSLTATNAGGSDTATKERYISVTEPAPVAGFAANQTSGYAPLAVNFTDMSTGAVSTRAWDFENDGLIDSTDISPVHVYTAPGNYTVNLTVANAGGSNSSVMTGYITVSAVTAPTVDFSANLTSGYAPLAVNFTDDSKGTGLISWSWDFNNDGTIDSTDQNPLYTFANPGNYTVSLSVKGRGGTTTAVKKDYISVAAAVPAKPKAEFVGTPTSGKAPLTVKFTDKSIGKDITGWAWDFNGDGVTDSTDQNPSYTYSKKGSYNVSLTVTNAGGADTKSKKCYIRVSQLEKPNADFRADRQSGDAPLTVKFTDMSRGDAITEWSWDFNNDGVVDSTEKNPTYTYSAAGKYAVRLVVTNAAGSDMEIKSDFITVKGGSQPPAGKKPVAVIFADKTWGTPPITVKFADQSQNNPSSRIWYFGDGSSSTEANPTHLYADPGIYFARLYVWNDYGSDQDYRFIFVLPKWLSFWATGPR